MANLARLKEIQAKFAERAVFLTIYTQEAHPTEGGDYINYFLPINEHKSIEERITAAGNVMCAKVPRSSFIITYAAMNKHCYFDVKDKNFVY